MIVSIRSDHGREFENSMLASFCNDQGTKQEFSDPRHLSGMELWKERTG